MRSRTGERGVSAILFALMLTALLSISALVIDIGAAFTERRHNQNTVDAAAMSAAVEAVLGGGVINDVVAEVRDKVDTTLGRPVTPAQWTECKDPDQLHHNTIELKAGNPEVAPATECISFSATFDQVRVKLPTQEAAGVFGPALGFGNLKTSAAAIAGIRSPGGISAPPFVALSTATQGDFICLRTSDNPQPQKLVNGMGPGTGPDRQPVTGERADPCDKTVYDVSSETYGTLLPFRYASSCTQQKSDTEVGVSIGIDHIMGYFPKGYDPTSSDPVKKTERIDGGSNCTTAYPNTFEVESGFNAQGLKCALLSIDSTGTCNGVPARLYRSTSSITFAGEKVENSAPWDFLRPAKQLLAEGAPDECVFLAASRPDPVDPAKPQFWEDGFKPWDPAHVVPTKLTYNAPTSYYLTADGRTWRPQTYAAIDMTAVADVDWDHFDKYDAFVECLELWDWKTDPVLFVDQMAASPRFAFVPKVAESKLVKNAAGKALVHIESFQPSYMYRLYQAVSSADVNCHPKDKTASPTFYTHDAGMKYSCGKANQNVDRLSSLMFACGMVSDILCNKDTGEPNFAGKDIYDFRLIE